MSPAPGSPNVVVGHPNGPRIAVLVCTHNPRPDHFRRCVAALQEQTLSPEGWELFIVDNASAREQAPRADLSWHPGVRLLHEPALGLTPARLTGIRAAAAELLVFVDDDNVLDPDFLETCLRVADEKPFLGSWSGQCRPEFEQPPPDWTRRYWGNLVIREFDREAWSNLPRLADTMPCGAGLCVRRPVARHYLALHESGRRSIQFDRAGASLMSGGDNDLAACACTVGLAVGLIPSLKLTHLIPRERLTEDYLSRLAEAISFSSTLLDAEYGIPVGSRGAVGLAADCLRLLRLRPPHRRIVGAAYRGRRRAARVLTASGSLSQAAVGAC